MSFSFSATGPADELRARVKASKQTEIPTSLREFVLWAINGAKCHDGPDAVVTISVGGHLDADATTRPGTSATVGVTSRRVDAIKPVPVPLPKPVPVPLPVQEPMAELALAAPTEEQKKLFNLSQSMMRLPSSP